MGKIKSKQIKKVANFFLAKGISFDKDFEKNKKIVGNAMPSKKLRNQLIGFLAKKKKQEKPLITKNLVEKK